MNNQELSELYIARIIVTLYECWANPTTLHASSITEVHFDTDLMFECQSAPHQWELFANVVHWLEKEGFIRSVGVGSHTYEFIGVSITLKAMEALKKVPAPLLPNSTLLDELKQAVTEGNKSAIHNAVNVSMSAVYKAISGYISL
jgi:hypothetical protein